MKIFKLVIIAFLAASTLNSCGTYIAAVCTISMASSDENAKVDTKNFISSNEDIELKYDLPNQVVTLKNTSDATLVIDLAQSSYIDKDRISQPLYTGQIIETFSSSTDAYGQGAAAARSVPNGVIGGNVSEAHSNTNSLRITEQQQRYIILSPKTAAKIKLPKPHSAYSITGSKHNDYSKEYTLSDTPVSSEYIFSYWDRVKGENEGMKSVGNLFYLSDVSFKGNIKEDAAYEYCSSKLPCKISGYVKLSNGLPILLFTGGVVLTGIGIYSCVAAGTSDNSGAVWGGILGICGAVGCYGGGFATLNENKGPQKVAVIKL